ncbi:MAG TPA: sigma-70 family RNA polymerase sigma factor [Candidatus Angelobacter sp.]|jgi:RNA polymerase sigma factor (sigma-70 family)|nr:sigma-70 family RNA polymerase sigma factor [Candidatus Angelobacter sp.]
MSILSLTTEELIRACVAGERRAWEEFILRYDKLIAGVVFRTAEYWGYASSESLKDMVQEVYAKLCENNCYLLRQFEARHDGAIYGYLKAIAANEVHDRLRQLHSEKRGSGHIDALESIKNEPVATHDGSQAAIEQQLLFKEIDDLLRAHLPQSTQERDRTIFWLRHRQGLTAREIASFPAIELSAKGVESTMRRLEQLVRAVMAEGGDRLPPRGEKKDLQKDWVS